MTNRRHVSPGEPARRNMTAAHYNDAIPPTIRSTRIPEERSIHREEIIYCVVDDDSPTIPTGTRYVTVAVLDLKRRADLDTMVPRTSADTGLIDDCNWSIAQEGVLAKDTCLTCIGGLTRAVVDVSDPLHKFVTWDKNLGILISHPFSGKGQLIEVGDPADDIALIYISKCPNVEEIPIMRFFADTKIVNRKFTVTVDIASGNVINPGTGFPIQPGDSGIEVHDPGQLFGEIEIDGTGFAYYRRTRTPSSPLSHEKRWEVEECSLPINKIEGKIEECLLNTDGTATVKFGSVNGHANYILTSWPNVDFPPEITINAANDFEVIASNPYHLDATENSLVTIRRHTDIQQSDPRNLVSPKAASATSEGWEIMHVYEQIARWAKFVKSGTFNLDSFWEGGNPAPCSADSLTCAFDCSCLEDGDEIIGFYDPVGNNYIGISTASALMGPPDTIQTLVGTLSFDGSECSITYSRQDIKAFACGSSPVPLSLALPTYTVNALDNLYADGSQVCASYTEVNVVACTLGGTNRFCVDICPILCLCEEIYSLPDICDPPPPPPCNCACCLFIQGPIAIQITWDGDTQGTTVIEKGTGECEWLAIFEDMDAGASPGDTIAMTVTFVGGSEEDGTWTVEGPWPGATNNGTIMTFEGVGDCSGSDILEDTGHTPSSGEIVTDGGSCDCTPDCCSEWTGDEGVTGFTGSNNGDFTVDIDPGLYPITDGGGTLEGSCGKVADVDVTITDQLTGGTCSVTVAMELFYDRNINGGDENDKGCRWHYIIPGCQPSMGGPAFGGDSGAVLGCKGGFCEGALGTCGGFLTLEITITDPDASITGDCNDPEDP